MAPPKPTAQISSAQAKDPSRLARAINELARGGLDSFGTVTLTPSATETEVANPLVRAGAHITLTPLTANAATAWAAGCWIEANPAGGSFTIHHASSADTDQDFSYGFIG